MGNKDLTEKILEDYNDVFADIVNVLLFKGERIIKENDLVNTNVHSQYKAANDILHEQERDISKFWNYHNVRIAVLGIENQTQPEKHMPLRVVGYEGASYREQLGNKNLYPVVTLVLYFGTETRWNYKKTLKELVNIPECLEDYVNDVKVNVFEIAWLPDEVINQFTSDFKIVANFFAEKRKNKDYVPKDKTTIKHIDAVLKLLSVMTKDNRYERILAEGKDVESMCEVADRLEQKGREEGRAEIIKNMLKNGMDMEEIARLADVDISVVQEVEKTK